MRALAVNPSEKEIAIVSCEEPALGGPTDVKVRMLEVGVCGTDKEISEFEYGTPPSGSPRLVLGHEGLGEVVEVGAGVTRVKAGDLVVPVVRRPCAHSECDPCRAERQDYCETGDYVERGIKEANGFLADFVVDDERFLNVVPRELRDVGVLTEPLTIAEKALDQLWTVQKRLPWPTREELAAGSSDPLNAVVLGAGPVSLLGAMLLRASGFTTYVYSRAEAPNAASELAEAFGATYVSSSTESADRLAEIVGNVDAVYEGTGASAFSFDVLRVLGTNGVFVFTGVPGGPKKTEIDTNLLMKNIVLKNQAILGTVNANRAMFESAIGHLGVFSERWPDAVRRLITARHPLEAHRDLLLGDAGGIKHVIALGA